MVQIIRARIPRKILANLESRNWYKLVKERSQDGCICIERSVPLDTRLDDDLLKLLSAMEAMLRRYDDMKPLFAKRHPPKTQATQDKNQHMSAQTKPGADHQLSSSSERGRLRTRKGDPSSGNQVSNARQKQSSDSSLNTSTHKTSASPQQRSVMSTSKRGSSHSNSPTRGISASRAGAPHMTQVVPVGGGQSRTTRSPPRQSSSNLPTEGRATSQQPHLSSASSRRPAQISQGQKSTS